MSNQKLSNPNPYDVLEVSPAASNQEIAIAFAMAMKKRQYNPKQIAEARKILMNPQQRLIADYLRPILPPIQRFKKEDLSLLNESEPAVEFLAEFDNLDDNIVESMQISISDQKLGLKLFS